VGDLLALLDNQEVDEAGEGIAEEAEVLLPVPRRVCECPHAVERQRERRSVAFPSSEAEVGQNLLGIDP
jgi:hypothetical protein